MNFKELYQGLKSNIREKVTSFKDNHQTAISYIKQGLYTIEAFALGGLPFTIQGQNYTGKDKTTPNKEISVNNNNGDRSVNILPENAAQLDSIVAQNYSNENNNNNQSEWVYKGVAKDLSGLKSVNDFEYDLMVADTAIAVNNNLPLPEYHKTHIFQNSNTGEIRNIWLALATSMDTASGGDLAGHTWTQYLNEGDQELLESLSNACLEFYDIDTVQNVDTYTASATEHLIGCGYITTSIEEPIFEEADLITPYPNPTNSGLNIKQNEKISSLTIRNMQGQVLHQGIPDYDANSVFVVPGFEQLPSGVYTVTATSKNKTETEKVIKQ